MSKYRRKQQKKRLKNKPKKEENMSMLTDLIKGKQKELVKVFIVHHGRSRGSEYSKWIDADPFMRTVKTPDEADVLVFTGGADISPAIYHQPAHAKTYSSMDRDRHEIAMFCMGLDKLKVGICRGAQLLNALSGGSIIQHVEGHASGPHNIELMRENGAILRNVPSTHHQMMLPSPNVEDRVILALAKDDDDKNNFITNPMKKYVPEVMARQKWPFLNRYRASDFNPLTQDLEIVFYSSTRSLCVQSHPEKFSSPPYFTAYVNSLIVSLAERSIEMRLTDTTKEK